MQYARTFLLLPTFVAGLAATSLDAQAQGLPSGWDRLVEWVVPPDSAAGTTNGNPAPDSEGNLVWHYEYVTSGGGLASGSPWYEELATPLVWDIAWYSGTGAWVTSDNFGTVIKGTHLTHAGQWYDHRPIVRWENATSETFQLGITGSLRVGWSGDFQALPVDVDVVVAHRDAATGTLTQLYAATIPKPHNNNVKESLIIPVDLVPIPISPDDELIISLHGFEQASNQYWVNLTDNKLCLVRDPIGTRYCGPAVVNSSGYPGQIAASGSEVVSDDELTLKAFQLPTDQFGYFLASRNQGFVTNPGGSQGNLCLGQPLGRFAALIQSSGPAGMMSISVDLTNIPLLGPVAVGETWNFQCWFRDVNPTSTSNFTDAVAVLFQ
jgi:hypothetical protein